MIPAGDPVAAGLCAAAILGGCAVLIVFTQRLRLAFRPRRPASNPQQGDPAP